MLTQDVVRQSVERNDVRPGTLNRRQRIVHDVGDFVAFGGKFILHRIKSRTGSENPDRLDLVDL